VRDYQFHNPSRPLKSVSAVGVLVRDPLPRPGATERQRELARLLADPETLRGVRAYQFVERPRLVIDHCSVSEMCLLLYESGRWSLSLRADQNPLQLDPPLVDRQVTSSEETRLYTAHLKRNQFMIQVRCYAAYRTSSEAGLVGKPLVIPLDVKPFWVQKADPYYLYREGDDARIRNWYRDIDRVELEFSYR
jgi:hypothetical protein